MSGFGKRLGLRLFLEGMEVPVVSAQIQMNLDAPATASIQVVPGDGVLGLRPRTMVHLFFWDYTLDTTVGTPQDPEVLASLYGITVDEAKSLIKDNAEALVDRYDADLSGYKLLFCGEIIGIVLVKAPEQRQAVLQCSDFSTYWDTTYQFFISYSPGGNFLGSSAGIWAAGENLFNNIMSGHTMVLNQCLKGPPETPGLKQVKGLMGGIIKLMEVMGGVPQHTRGVNDFFTIGELKNHILQQIVAEQNDDTAQRLFDNKTFMSWLTNSLSSLGQLVTFREMMKLLFKYVYYEVAPNPCARYIPSIETTSKTKTVKVTEDFSEEVIAAISQLITKSDGYASAVWKGDRFDEPAAAKQFALELDKILKVTGSHQASHKLLEQAKLKTNDIKGYPASTPVNVLQQTTDAKDKWFEASFGDRRKQPAGGQSLAKGYDFSSAAGMVNPDFYKPSFSIDSRQSLPDVQKNGPRQFIENRLIWMRINDLLRQSLNRATIQRNKDVTTVKPGELDFLYTQIFRPDCFFAPPPRCNVLFPDQYTQFQFSRNFLQECTRLRLSTDLMFGINQGAYGLLGQYNFAPSMKDIKKIAASQENTGLRSLLPWEIYSGILPKFESMHEINYIANRYGKDHPISGTLAGTVIDYPQRAADFNYMKYRFASRSCEISAYFNPFLVCGFPMLVIDKPFFLYPNQVADARKEIPENLADDMSEFVRMAARKYRAPTQFLGMVAALSHSVDQKGGGSSVILTHARSHRVTDDDFLGMVSTEATADVTTEIVSTELDAEDLLRKGDARLLGFLKDITPQDLDQQAGVTALKEQLGPDDVALETRPGTTPAEANKLSDFAGLVTRKQELEVASTPNPTLPADMPTDMHGNRYLLIEGGVTQARMPNSNKVNLVPDPGGKLSATGNSIGPLGGKIVQIAIAGDATTKKAPAMAVVNLGFVRSSTKVDDPRAVKVVQASAASGSSIGTAIGAAVAGPIGAAIGAGVGGGAPIAATAATGLPKKTVTRTSVRMGDTTDMFTINPVNGAVTLLGLPLDRKKVTYLWKKATIYEKSTKPKKTNKLLPVEEAMRPPWFSPLYSNWLIGSEIYEKFFGCGSIVDQALFTVKGSDATAAFGTSRQKQQEMLDKVRDAKDNPDALRKIVDEAAAKNISDVPDIEASTDVLAYIYAEVRRLGLDVSKFIHDYIRRPIATLYEVLGSADLRYGVSGDKLVLVSGKPGFHSAAVADVGGQLRGLLDNPDMKMARLLGTGKRESVSRDLDPRPGRREKVRDYILELRAATGSLGVGLPG